MGPPTTTAGRRTSGPPRRQHRGVSLNFSIPFLAAYAPAGVSDSRADFFESAEIFFFRGGGWIAEVGMRNERAAAGVSGIAGDGFFVGGGRNRRVFSES